MSAKFGGSKPTRNMARTVFDDPVRELHGAYTKGGSISRRKTYRDSKGRIKGMSEPETYKIEHPRDWKKNPAKGKELEHQLRFKQACAETHRILLPSKPQAYAAAHAADHPDGSAATPTPEELATLKMWQSRFEAQLNKPEPDAPIDPKTGKRKQYFRLDAFIRTCLLREME